MLDIGGWEFLLIAILGIMIIGPKELPGAIRTVSMFVRRARELARDFQSGIEEVAREAELDKLTDDIKEIAADGTGAGNLRDELQGAVDPDGTLAQAMDYETDWTDDDLIDYDAPEFADDNRISPPEQPNKADTAKSALPKPTPAIKTLRPRKVPGKMSTVSSAGAAVTENTAAGEPDVETTQPSPEAESGKKPDGAS